MTNLAWKADLFQSPRLPDAEGKRGHSGTFPHEIGHTRARIGQTGARFQALTVAKTVTRIPPDGCKAAT